MDLAKLADYRAQPGLVHMALSLLWNADEVTATTTGNAPATTIQKGTEATANKEKEVKDTTAAAAAAAAAAASTTSNNNSASFPTPTPTATANTHHHQQRFQLVHKLRRLWVGAELMNLCVEIGHGHDYGHTYDYGEQHHSGHAAVAADHDHAHAHAHAQANAHAHAHAHGSEGGNDNGDSVPGKMSIASSIVPASLRLVAVQVT